MLNKKTLCDLRSETGLDYNDKDQIKSALRMANFAMHELEENSCEKKMKYYFHYIKTHHF